MRIGILTFHNACSHGAVLQCYALQTVLERLGHEVRIIDYRQKYIENLYSPFSLELLPLRPCAAYRYLREIKNKLGIRLKFKSFLPKYLHVTSKVCDAETLPTDFDTYIIGSDQVWSVNCTKKLDPVYFGRFKRDKTSRMIGYGISVPENLLKEIEIPWLKESLSRFDAISFREQKNTEYISGLFPFSKPVTVVDPTLLLDKEDYDDLMESEAPKGVCTYIFDYRLSKKQRKDISRQAMQYASANCLPLFNLQKKLINPGELISYIKDADIVITNSFHVCVMSIILRKKFQCIVCGDESDLRYEALLKSIGAENALCKPESLDFNVSINYKTIEKNLRKLRNQSLNFLYRNLTVAAASLPQTCPHEPTTVAAAGMPQQQNTKSDNESPASNICNSGSL